MKKPLVLPNGISVLFTQLEINSVENLLNIGAIQSDSIIEILRNEEEIRCYVDYERVKNINHPTKELRKILKDNKIISLILFEEAYFYSATLIIEECDGVKKYVTE